MSTMHAARGDARRCRAPITAAQRSAPSRQGSRYPQRTPAASAVVRNRRTSTSSTCASARSSARVRAGRPTETRRTAPIPLGSAASKAAMGSSPAALTGNDLCRPTPPSLANAHFTRLLPTSSNSRRCRDFSLMPAPAR